MPEDPRPATRDPRPKPRGGRRPGAGAPRGNLNGLRTGAHSRRVRAFSVALQQLPRMAGLLQAMDSAGDTSRVQFAQALHYLADLILLDKTQSIDSPQDTALQIRDIMKRIEKHEI